MSSPLIITQGPKAESRAAFNDDFIAAGAALSPRKDGQFYIGSNGGVYRHHTQSGSTLILAPEYAPVSDDHFRATTRDKRDALMRLKLLIQMRDNIRVILSKQEATSDEKVAQMAEAPWAADQRCLKTLYDNFVSAYGPINRTQLQQTGTHDETGGQVSFIKQPNLQRFRKDPDAMLVASIERYDEATDTAKPGPIFTERVLAARGQKPIIVTARDALRHVLDINARFDLDAVAKLLPLREPGDIVAELAKQELIFLNPATKSWQTAEEYLSGDIRAKLKTARAAAEKDPAFAPAVAALEKVKPADLSLAQIDFSLGAPWLPPALVESFGRDVLGIDDIHVRYLPKTHKWFVSGKNSETSPAASADWAVKTTDIGETKEVPQKEGDFSFEERSALKGHFQDWITADMKRATRLEAALNREAAAHITVADNDTAANDTKENFPAQKFTHLQQSMDMCFRDWIKESPQRTAAIETLYNNRFNSDVTPRYDGSHMTLPGASVAIKPYAHQLGVAWRNILRGNTLNAHPVGAGKTIDIIISCMEMRRLGRIDKPLIVVPNNLLAQFSRDFMQLYPNAHMLVLDTDSLEGDDAKRSTTERVENFVERTRAPAWDAIVMTQENFDRFEVSPQKRLRILVDDIREFQKFSNRSDYAGDQKVQRHLAKITRKKIAALRDFLDLNMGSEKTPENFDLDAALSQNTSAAIWNPVVSRLRPTEFPSFEKMGVDYVFIDESQNYKNLEVVSGDRMLSLKGSARATNLRFKLSLLEEKRPGYCVTMTTGTPLSNALSEIYTLQRYMAGQELRDKGLSNFDAWRTMFAENVTTFEMSPEGTGFRYTTRLGRYQNVPELVRMFHGFTDLVDEDKLNLKKPAINGGEPATSISALSPKQAAIREWLAARAKRVRVGLVGREEDNILKIIVDGRRAALHPRLVWKQYVQDVEAGRHDGPVDVPDAPGKIDDMVCKVAEIYHATRNNVYYDINGQPEALRGATQMVMCDQGVPGGKIDPSLYHDMRSKLVALGIPFNAIRFEHDYKSDRKKAILAEHCRTGQVAVVIGTTTGLGTGSNVHRRLIALHELDEPWTPSGVRQRRGRIDRPGNANPQIDIIRYVTEGLHDVYSWQTILRKAKFIGQIMRGDPAIRRYEEIDPMIREFAVVLNKATNGPHEPPAPNTARPAPGTALG